MAYVVWALLEKFFGFSFKTANIQLFAIK